MGFDPMCVTTKRILKKLGGDKIPGKVYTFDGDTTGKTVIGDVVKISEDAPDLKKTTKIVVTLDDGTAREFSPDAFDFLVDEPYTQGFTGKNDPELIMVASIPVGDDETPAGLYVINEPHVYVSRIEFADTIHPIDPKYLPGVCLPVVELTEFPTSVDGLVWLDAATAATMEATVSAGINYVLAAFVGDGAIPPTCAVLGRYLKNVEDAPPTFAGPMITSIDAGTINNTGETIGKHHAEAYVITIAKDPDSGQWVVAFQETLYG